MEGNYIEKQNSALLFKKKIDLYFSKWKWFFLSLIIALFCSFLYLKCATLVYKTNAKILIKDPSSSGSLSEFAAFSDISPLPISNNVIADELDIFKSKKLISEVVKKYNLNVEQFKEEKFRAIDIYGNSPYYFSFLKEKKAQGVQVTFNIVSPTSYELITEKGKIFKGAFGIPMQFNNGELLIDKNKNYKGESNNESIFLKIHSIPNYASKIQKDVTVNLKDKGSSVVVLSMRNTNGKKAEDILNGLIKEYNFQAIEEQNLVAKNTSDFIAERLQIIKNELDVVEVNKVSFKKGNNLTDIASEAKLFIDQSGESQGKLFNVEIQLELIEAMIVYLKDKNRDSDLLPANIGIENSELNELMGKYNQMIFEKNSMLKSSTELNPYVVKLSNEIENQKKILLESLRSQKNNQLIVKKDIKKLNNKIKGKIASIPQQEKDYRVIERQQNVKEALYLFLLQKREETSLSMARTLPKAKIIEAADTSTIPVAPSKKNIILLGLILGLFIPYGIIYAKNFFDTKIEDKLELETALKNIPILGELPRIKNDGLGVITKNDRSILGESFRVLRSNLNYFLKIKKKDNKALKIFITSTIKGEGKTFVAYNTALSIIEASKKVLVIGADIRNPQMHRYLDVNRKISGLSEFLYDDEVEIEDILNSVQINESNIDFILSGSIPPNPSELLMNGRFEKLVNELESVYDYILIDTAPTMLVADTLSICELADVMMYVVRAGFTDKNLIGYINKLNTEGKINNVALVLNDVKESNIGYGYSYGYGESSKKSIFHKIINKA
ncbi:GumC family protein [Aquimarina agarilytica]|uniref:GumC family protein n=1 Tax=Aquimarina agarilytica TaxID=1087449 RepID=UPI000289D570|nr:tyrosine-protein kinase [Aquimarina agarilytica]